jgi:hypothetical protein
MRQFVGKLDWTKSFRSLVLGFEKDQLEFGAVKGSIL